MGSARLITRGGVFLSPGTIPNGTTFGWNGTDEAIERGNAAGGLSDYVGIVVNALARVRAFTDRIRLLNGAEIIESLVANGAAAVAMRMAWLAGVATPTDGATLQDWTWENNAGLVRRVLRLYRAANNWILELSDIVGNGIFRVGYNGTATYFQSVAPSVELQVIAGNAGVDRLALWGAELRQGNGPLTWALTNRTGVAIAAGYVGKLDVANNSSLAVLVGTGPAIPEKTPLVVVTGGANLAAIYVATAGRVTTAAADAQAVVAGDTIVSAAAGLCSANNAITDPALIVGRALTAKGAGAGNIQVLLR